MGTSGAYGGSGSAAWAQAHDAYANAATGTESAPAAKPTPTSSGDAPPAPDPAVAELIAALARGLNRKSSHTPSSAGTYALGRTAPSRRSGGGYTRSRSSTSSGTGTNGLARRAARGAAALAGAQAYRAGDAATLNELGLSLSALRELPNDRARCNAIVNALLGAPGHPDDAALNAVATETMMQILSDGTQSPPDDLLCAFTANLAFELTLVELTSQYRDEPLPPAEAAKIEQDSKQMIVNALAAEGSTSTGRLTAQGLIDKAANLAGKVLRVFGRRR